MRKILLLQLIVSSFILVCHAAVSAKPTSKKAMRRTTLHSAKKHSEPHPPPRSEVSRGVPVAPAVNSLSTAVGPPATIQVPEVVKPFNVPVRLEPSLSPVAIKLAATLGSQLLVNPTSIATYQVNSTSFIAQGRTGLSFFIKNHDERDGFAIDTDIGLTGKGGPAGFFQFETSVGLIGRSAPLISWNTERQALRLLAGPRVFYRYLSYSRPDAEAVYPIPRPAHLFGATLLLGAEVKVNSQSWFALTFNPGIAAYVLDTQSSQAARTSIPYSSDKNRVVGTPEISAEFIFTHRF